jgi:hypothetical protein
MEQLSVYILGVPKRSNMACQKEVERFELSRIRLAVIQAGKWLHDRWAADGDAADCWPILKRRSRRRQTKNSPNDPQPRLRDPISVLAPDVDRIQQMAEPML